MALRSRRLLIAPRFVEVRDDGQQARGLTFPSADGAGVPSGCASVRDAQPSAWAASVSWLSFSWRGRGTRRFSSWRRRDVPAPAAPRWRAWNGPRLASPVPALAEVRGQLLQQRPWRAGPCVRSAATCCAVGRLGDGPFLGLGHQFGSQVAGPGQQDGNLRPSAEHGAAPWRAGAPASRGDENTAEDPAQQPEDHPRRWPQNTARAAPTAMAHGDAQRRHPARPAQAPQTAASAEQHARPATTASGSGGLLIEIGRLSAAARHPPLQVEPRQQRLDFCHRASIRFSWPPPCAVPSQLLLHIFCPPSDTESAIHSASFSSPPMRRSLCFSAALQALERSSGKDCWAAASSAAWRRVRSPPAPCEGGIQFGQLALLVCGQGLVASFSLLDGRFFEPERKASALPRLAALLDESPQVAKARHRDRTAGRA